MFNNLFKKKAPSIKIIDKIAISEKGKLQALLAEWNRDQNAVFVFWFDDSLRQAQSFFASEGKEIPGLYTARQAGTSHFEGRQVIFAEHYPLRSKEEQLYEKLRLQTVIVFSSLTEPLFKKFGADRIIRLMQQLDIPEDELTEHAMISKSIRQAQEKIEKKIIVEQSAGSQREWLERNLPGGNS